MTRPGVTSPRSHSIQDCRSLLGSGAGTSIGATLVPAAGGPVGQHARDRPGLLLVAGRPAGWPSGGGRRVPAGRRRRWRAGAWGRHRRGEGDVVVVADRRARGSTWSWWSRWSWWSGARGGGRWWSWPVVAVGDRCRRRDALVVVVVVAGTGLAATLHRRAQFDFDRPGATDGLACIITAPERYFITYRARAMSLGLVVSTNVSLVFDGHRACGLPADLQALGGQRLAGRQGGVVAAGEADDADRFGGHGPWEKRSRPTPL